MKNIYLTLLDAKFRYFDQIKILIHSESNLFCIIFILININLFSMIVFDKMNSNTSNEKFKERIIIFTELSGKIS